MKIWLTQLPKKKKNQLCSMIWVILAEEVDSAIEVFRFMNPICSLKECGKTIANCACRCLNCKKGLHSLKVSTFNIQDLVVFHCVVIFVFIFGYFR